MLRAALRGKLCGHPLGSPIRALVVLALAVLVVAPPASAEQQIKTLTVDAGSKKRITAHSHFSFQTCGALSIPKILVTRRPTKGDVSILPESFIMGKADTKRGEICLGRSVKGVAIYYTAREGSIGSDELAYTVQYPSSCNNCTEKEITATISIIAPSRPSIVDGTASEILARTEDERATSKDDAEAEAAKRAADEEQESSETKPLLMPALGSPVAAADDATCFLHGSDKYKRPEIMAQSLSACSHVISSGNVSGTRLAFYYRGRAYWKLKFKDLDGALDDCNLGLSLDPNNVEGYDNRADIWKAKGQIDRAIGDYQMALRIDPKYAAAYFGRGRIFEREGSVDKARTDYNSALAVPQKDHLAKWAQDQARERLSELDK
jgi:hypothetical protein